MTMMIPFLIAVTLSVGQGVVSARSEQNAPHRQGAKNPILWADIPDCAVIRVKNTYYGYRFVLFHYATKNIGGSVDFDWFRVGD